MAKEEKKKPKEASKTFHEIMKASVSPKTNIMNKEQLGKLKEEVKNKLAKYLNEFEGDNTTGISTSKDQYLAALKEWEDAYRIYLKANKNG